jgi:hypothetical protein
MQELLQVGELRTSSGFQRRDLLRAQVVADPTEEGEVALVLETTIRI